MVRKILPGIFAAFWGLLQLVFSVKFDYNSHNTVMLDVLKDLGLELTLEDVKFIGSNDFKPNQLLTSGQMI